MIATPGYDNLSGTKRQVLRLNKEKGPRIAALINNTAATKEAQMSAYSQVPEFDTAEFQALSDFLKRTAQRSIPPKCFEEFETTLQEHISRFQAAAVGLQLRRYDEDAEQVEIDGREYRKKIGACKDYTCAAGSVRVERQLYVPATGPGRAVCPLDLRVGIVEGQWTPRAARLMAQSMACMTAKEANQFFSDLGGMSPSTSSLDRLPKSLGEIWERDREAFEEELRVNELIPREAAIVSASLDGVMAPMKGTGRSETRKKKDKLPRGPAGHREVGCGTITLYDDQGNRLHTVRFGRMPEANKLTLKKQLRAELESILLARPDLKVSLIADGADDNWTYFNELVDHLGIEDSARAVDIFHALERLNMAVTACYGEGTPHAKVKFEEYRTWLRELDDGAQKVVRSLRHIRSQTTGWRHDKIGETISYMSKRVNLMNYAELLRNNLPIGSGIVEATCKTLVTQRMKRSGMSWRPKGGQSILTLRALLQSERWSAGWSLLSRQYHREVRVLAHRRAAA